MQTLVLICFTAHRHSIGNKAPKIHILLDDDNGNRTKLNALKDIITRLLLTRLSLNNRKLRDTVIYLRRVWILHYMFSKWFYTIRLWPSQ